MSPSTRNPLTKGAKGSRETSPLCLPLHLLLQIFLSLLAGNHAVSLTAAPAPPSTLHHTAPIVALSIPLAAAAPYQALYMPPPPSYMQPSFMPPLPSYPGFQYPATAPHAAQAQYPHPYMEDSSIEGLHRKVGANRYKKDDKLLLAQLVLKLKPTGPNWWKILINMYNKNARTRGLSTRECKALCVKFDQIVSKPKPTGEGKMPEYQDVALKADEQITQKVASSHIDNNRVSIEWPELSLAQSVISITDGSDNNVVVAPPVKLDVVDGPTSP
ncbi:hypothetical protein BC835DRAFT_1422617 [Cytidiella melzeri]|nr:hypothetical protein BC835DRAFT_1422617 [Cytidiella melzeri]